MPGVISASSDELVTEWCGQQTLDDALQAGLAVSGAALSEAVSGVGRALATLAPAPSAAHDALRAQLAPWLAALPAALRWLSGAYEERLMAEVIQLALECPPEAGSLDYTARNVLVGATGEQVWLIDFAATGFDWTERRLAQYALSAGAGRPTGVFRSALDATICGALEDPTGVDAHEVILLLTAAGHLRQVETGEAHDERSLAWANVAERKASLLTLLRRPVAESGPAAELRAALR